MKKSELKAAVESHKKETQEVLQTMYDGLSSTKRKKMAKDKSVKKMFKHFGGKLEGDDDAMET